jgi:hypothetical protein
VRAASLVVAAIALAGAACTTQPLSPDAPRRVDKLPIASYVSHETCVDLVPGDRLDYRWQASEPVDFDIRYRDGGAIVSPVVRARSRGDSGIFAARIGERYCLDWQAGAAATVLDYRLDIRGAMKPGQSSP